MCHRLHQRQRDRLPPRGEAEHVHGAEHGRHLGAFAGKLDREAVRLRLQRRTLPPRAGNDYLEVRQVAPAQFGYCGQEHVEAFLLRQPANRAGSQSGVAMRRHRSLRDLDPVADEDGAIGRRAEIDQPLEDPPRRRDRRGRTVSHPGEIDASVSG
jgi:hypothetical protein